MSGIWGYISLRKEEPKVNLLRAWNKAYGSVEQFSCSGGWGLGFFYDEMSSVENAMQKLDITSNICGVSDSLIYNRSNLDKMGILNFLSDSDFLLRYIETEGVKELKRVNGDFSGAIVNHEKNQLLLFRDHVGVRPLYYWYTNEMVIFSSDIRGLIALDEVDKSVCEASLYETACGIRLVRTEETEFEHIFCVPPGGYVSFSVFDGKIKIKKDTYWKLEKKRIPKMSRSDYAKKLRELITESIQRRLDVFPGIVGSELSGGLDSSVISILINRLGREGVYYSWSVSPEELPYVKGDERLGIKAVCEKEGISCIYKKMESEGLSGKESILAQKMDNIGLNSYEKDGLLLGYVMPTYFNTPTLTSASYSIGKNGARCIFTGHGGDEGVSHRSNPFEMLYNGEIYHFLRHNWSLSHGKKHRISKTFRYVVNEISYGLKQMFGPVKNPLSPTGILSVDFEKRGRKFPLNRGIFAFDPIKYIRGGGSGNRLDNTSLQGAYSNIRYVFPFLDKEVLEYAVSIPRYTFHKKSINRFVYREAFKDILPKSILTCFVKEDVSEMSLETESDEEKNQQLKDELEFSLKYIDLPFWKNYLNMEEILKWTQRDFSSDEERESAMELAIFLSYCSRINNMIKKCPLAKI